MVGVNFRSRTMSRVISTFAIAVMRAYARVKNQKCSKFNFDQFRVRFRSFRAFQKFPRVRARPRVFARAARRKGIISSFLHDLDS